MHPTHFLFLSALGHLAIEVCSNFLPVVYPVFIDTLGLSYAQVGMVALVSGLTTSLPQPLFGYLSDRWGPRRMSVLSIAWNGIVMALVGFATDYPSLILVVGLGMLGSAAFHPSGATIASQGNTIRRGAAVSVFSVGGNIGAALSPLWVTAGMGWMGLRGTSVLIPVALLITVFLYQQLARGAQADCRPMVTHRNVTVRWSWTWLVLILLAVMFRSWFQMAFMTYLPTWIQDQGGSLAAGGHMLFVLLASVGVGSLIGGTLSDRIGRWQVMALSLGLLGPAAWLFLDASDVVQVALLGTIGALMGATFPVSIVMAQETWPSGLGVASGMVIGLPWIGGGVGAALTGLLADHVSLTTGLRALSLPALLGTACILAYAMLRHRS